MKAKNFDKKFDQGKKDIIDDLDLSTARRANQDQKRINVGFTLAGRAKRGTVVRILAILSCVLLVLSPCSVEADSWVQPSIAKYTSISGDYLCLDRPDRWRYRNTMLLSIGAIMTEVTVSPKYQIVIPKEIRESMGIVSGQKVQIISYQGRIEVIPLKPMKEMRGFLKGIDTTVVREEDRI